MKHFWHKISIIAQYNWARFCCCFVTQRRQQRIWHHRLDKVKDFCSLYIRHDSYNLVLRDGFGDSFLILAFARQLATQHPGKLFFLVKPSQEFLLKMFGFSQYKVCDMLSVKDLRNYTLNDAAYPEIGKVFFSHPRYHHLTEGFMNSSVNFTEVFKKLFRLSPETLPDDFYQYPEISHRAIKQLSRYNNLKKVVLLCPETNSCIIENIAWWKELSQSLQKKGFFVCINAISRTEIPGKNFKFSSTDLIAVASKCRAVVSIRNGLCDILHKKGQNLFVIDYSFHSPKEKSFFNVNSMFPNSKVREYLNISELSTTQLIKDIEALEA